MGIMRYPEVMCEGSEFAGMVVIGMILLAICLAFVSVVVWFGFSAPKASEWQLAAVKFAWIKYRPDRWYWGGAMLIRGLGLALVPVMVPDDPRSQVLLIFLAMTFYLACLCAARPWKIAAYNMFDAILCTCAVIILVASSAFMPVLVSVVTWAALSFAAFLVIYISAGLVLVGSLISMLLFGRMENAHHFFDLRKSPMGVNKMAEDFVGACAQLKSVELAQGMSTWNSPDFDAVAKAMETLKAMGSIPVGSD